MAWDSIQSQGRQALSNCEAIFQAGGATLHDVVGVRLVLTDPSDFAGMNASRSARPRPSTETRSGGTVDVVERPRRVTATRVRASQSDRLRRRRRWYFGLMATCLVLILLAWNVVRLWSTTAALVMSAVAAVIPPVAAIVANWHEDH